MKLKLVKKKTNGAGKKSGQIRIRQMTIEDLAAVYHLGLKLFTFSKSPTLFRTWDEFEVIDHYSSDPEYCLVATVKDTIVGFILSTIIDKRHSRRKYGYLVWIGIDPKYQGAGVGMRLFEEFKEIMAEEGAHMLLIDIEVENEQARKFFTRIGFSSPQDFIYLSCPMEKPD